MGGNGPIGAVRVIEDEHGEMVANPTRAQMDAEGTSCNLLYVGTRDNCVMIETDVALISDDGYCRVLELAQRHVADVVGAI